MGEGDFGRFLKWSWKNKKIDSLLSYVFFLLIVRFLLFIALLVNIPISIKNQHTGVAERKIQA